MTEMSYSKAPDPPPKRKAQGKIFRPGDTIAGRFEVIRPLRKGGNGDVYLVKHTEFPDRLLAMKTLKPNATDDFEMAVARFRNEVIAAYSVTHPNVVRIFDYIREGDFIAFTMEYIVGGDLADILSNHRRLTMHQVLHLFAQICDGVQAIHEAHIIHRDLKPENILITKDGKVKISDFGTARRGATLSKKGGLTGTIAYLSPEYLRDGQLDQRSDIYALGILAYEMITSETPFKGETMIETLANRLRETPPAPNELNPLCPAFLGKIILKCLKHDPEERYQSVLEIQRDLKKVSLSRVTPSLDTAGVSTTTPFSGSSDKLSVRVQQPPPPPRDGSESSLRGMIPTTRQPVVNEPEVKQVRREPMTTPLVARTAKARRQRKRPSRVKMAMMILLCFAIGAGAAAVAAKSMRDGKLVLPFGNDDSRIVGDTPESDAAKLKQEANAQLSKLAKVVAEPETSAARGLEGSEPLPPEPLPPAPMEAAPETAAPYVPEPVAPAPEALIPEPPAALLVAPKTSAGKGAKVSPQEEIPLPPPVADLPLGKKSGAATGNRGIIPPEPESLLTDNIEPPAPIEPRKIIPQRKIQLDPNGAEVDVSGTVPAGWYVNFDELAEKSEAETVVEMLSASGMSVKVETLTTDGISSYRVLLGPFSTQIEAEDRRNNLNLAPERLLLPVVKIVNG